MLNILQMPAFPGYGNECIHLTTTSRSNGLGNGLLVWHFGICINSNLLLSKIHVIYRVCVFMILP